MKHLKELYLRALKDYDEQLVLNEEHKKINGQLRETIKKQEDEIKELKKELKERDGRKYE